MWHVKLSEPGYRLPISPIEWELDPVTNERTGRWRRRQFYLQPGVKRDERPLSERLPVFGDLGARIRNEES